MHDYLFVFTQRKVINSGLTNFSFIKDITFF